MAIIIEHMEMPNGCCECRMQTENCCTLSLRRIDDVYDRPEWCLLVEAEPVKHGWWIWDKENDKMCCSECGYETDNWGVHQESDPIEWQLPNYCENCGVKMDLDKV